MAEPVRHRQTKGAATDMFGLQPLRHTPTLPTTASRSIVPRHWPGSTLAFVQFYVSNDALSICIVGVDE